MVDFIMDFMGLFSLHNKIHKIRRFSVSFSLTTFPALRLLYGSEETVGNERRTK